MIMDRQYPNWYSNPSNVVNDKGFSQSFMEWIVGDLVAPNCESWVELVMFELGWGM